MAPVNLQEVIEISNKTPQKLHFFLSIKLKIKANVAGAFNQKSEANNSRLSKNLILSRHAFLQKYLFTAMTAGC